MSEYYINLSVFINFENVLKCFITFHPVTSLVTQTFVSLAVASHVDYAINLHVNVHSWISH